MIEARMMDSESPAEESSPGTPPTTDDLGMTPEGAELFCPQCGYSLQGIAAADRCPECGLEIDRVGFAQTRIPWVYRRQIGRLVAYWRTVTMATIHPARLAAEASKPVGYRDAQWFRLITSAVFAAPVTLLLVGIMLWYGGTGFMNVVAPALFPAVLFGAGRIGSGPTWLLNVAIPWEAGATLAPVMPLALFAAAVLVTGVASYWFHPAALPVVRQNRAIALSHYACAPLFFLPVPAGAFMLAALFQRVALDDPGRTGIGPLITLFTTVATIGVVAVAFLFMRSNLVMLRRSTHASFARLAVAAVALPVLWVLCAAFALVGLPWVVGFFRLVITSLRG